MDMQLVDTPLAADNLVEPVDMLADIPAVDNQLVDKQVVHNLEEDIPEGGSQVAHKAAGKQAGNLVADSQPGNLVVGNQPDTPAADNRNLADTDILPADMDNLVAPDMAAVEFLAADDFQKPVRHLHARADSDSAAVPHWQAQYPF